MTKLEQAYVTHCTFSTSLYHQEPLERGGDRTYEYTTRAGSFDRSQGLSFYQKFRSVAYYRNYRPSGMSDDDLRQRTHADFPVRFAFLPGLGGHDLLIHACYRGHDTSKSRRAQCFFVHLLYQNRTKPVTAPLLTARQAIALWGSKSWVCEDSDQLSFQLPSHQAISDFAIPATEDFQNTLQSFLTANPDDQLVDPRQLIPERWKHASLEARQTLVRRILRAYLETCQKDRVSVVVAAEPEFAAFLFYAVARLLPQKGFTEALSFSTFELTTDSFFPAKLVGTRSETPKTTEFKNRTGGPVINTFKRSGVESPSGKERAFEKQLFLYISEQPEEWLTLLDRDLKYMDVAAPASPNELETLLPYVKQIGLLLAPQKNMELTLPSSKEQRDFVVRAVAPRVSELFLGPNRQIICDDPSIFEIYVTCMEQSTEVLTKKAAKKLGEMLTVDRVVSICQREALHEETRLQILAAFVDSPDGYGSIRKKLPLSQPIPGGTKTILQELLRLLPDDSFSEFLQATFAYKPTIENLLMLASGIATCKRAQAEHALFELLTWDGGSTSTSNAVSTNEAPAGKIAELLDKCMLQVNSEKKTSFIAAPPNREDSCLSFGVPVGPLFLLIITASKTFPRMLQLIASAVTELLNTKDNNYINFVDRVAIARSFVFVLKQDEDSDRRVRRYCSQLEELKKASDRLLAHRKSKHNRTGVSRQNEVIMAARKIVAGDRTYDDVSYPLEDSDGLLVLRVAEIYKSGIELLTITEERNRLSAIDSTCKNSSTNSKKKSIGFKAKMWKAGNACILILLGTVLFLFLAVALLLFYSFVYPADRVFFDLIWNWL